MFSPSGSATRQGRRADGYYTAFRMNRRSSTAQLPPQDLSGLDPTWSRLVVTADSQGIERTFHVLDTGGVSARGTVLCVHGNPNWSYMWRGLASALTDWRVIAVDALNMGYSERTGEPRRLADHIADLDCVTKELQIEGPTVTVAHDWGGAISMGWAHKNRDQLAGIVLMNTGVARPDAAKVPPLISIARATLPVTCEATPTFLHGALGMARPRLAREVYRAYAAPYRSANQRSGIRDFVEDIPIEASHPTFETLASVASGLGQLQDLPALLLWGAKDMIFSDVFLHDLIKRLPNARVHRYPDAGHQIMEDTDAVDVIRTWIGQHVDGADPVTPVVARPDTQPVSAHRMWSAIESRRGDHAEAIIEMDSKNSSRVSSSISFDDLANQVEVTARGLRAWGINAGDRIATLVPPGIDLTILVYACLRAGITVVAPDAALGLDGMRRALQSSRPDYLVGDWRGLLLAKSLRLPATRIAINYLSSPQTKVLGPTSSLAEIRRRGHGAEMPTEPGSCDTAVIVFTSGSTGPSKGVSYTHGQLEAQRDAIRAAFDVGLTDKIVVAFAPFAVLAPALGIASVVPPMDVSAPAKLQAATIADAAWAIDASIVFASPSVLANIAATSDGLDDADRRSFAQIRLVATAGAPVSPQLLAEVQPVFPQAHIATPYGMTEVMPVTLASAREITAGASQAGVCVGAPLAGVDLAIRAIGAPSGTMPEAFGPDQLGEVWIRADHVSAGYDQLWAKQRHAFSQQWHRSGDVGHIDTAGRLWIEGRVEHLIHGSTGTLAPVSIELQAESVEGVDRAAAVGIGPPGTQQVAVVIAGESLGRAVVADATITAAIRAVVTTDVAAVLVAPTIPVDRRHNSKIDRSRVQRWAAAQLSGSSRRRL